MLRLLACSFFSLSLLAPFPVISAEPALPAGAPSQPANGAATPAPPAEEEFLIEGKVQTTLNADNAIASVTVVVTALDERDREIKVLYRVVLDANGLQLGRDLAKKMVEVTCTLRNRGTPEQPEYWITVKSYQPYDEYGH